MLGINTAGRALRPEVEDLATSTPRRPPGDARSLDVGDDQEMSWAEPGAAVVRFAPKWTEQLEPYGVSWTTPEPAANVLTPSQTAVELLARSTSETGS